MMALAFALTDDLNVVVGPVAQDLGGGETGKQEVNGGGGCTSAGISAVQKYSG